MTPGYFILLLSLPFSKTDLARSLFSISKDPFTIKK